MNFVRFLMLLGLSVWLGALIFFPVVAATAFGALPSTHLAGLVVRGCLLKLHWIGFVWAALFLICSTFYNRMLLGQARTFAFSHVLIMFMAALTAISQFSVIAKMEALRLAASEIDLLPQGSAHR